MTALLEYLDLALIAHGWFSHYIPGLKLNPSKLLKGSSKLINPSTHQFSVDSAEPFVWEEDYTLLFFAVYLWPLAQFLSNHKRFEFDS